MALYFLTEDQFLTILTSPPYVKTAVISVIGHHGHALIYNIIKTEFATISPRWMTLEEFV